VSPAAEPPTARSSPPAARTANLLGALALAVTDRCVHAAGRQTGHGESEAAALSALDQFLDGVSIDHLADVVGLSQSGAVRLVDRLERDGLVRRGPSADGRATSLSLTPVGRTVARDMEAGRLGLLEDVLGALDTTEREELAVLIGKLLVGMMREPGATRWTCRLCDLDACGRDSGHCPIERAARARYGPHLNGAAHQPDP
jgi:DNA-binding MarR family transcriptional regulator